MVNSLLSKDALLGRSEEGELLPLEAQVDGLGGSILVKPITRGKLLEIRAKYLELDDPSLMEDFDKKLLMDYLVKPKLSVEEHDLLTVKKIKAITKAILDVSGLSSDDDTPVAIRKAEEELKKK